MKMLILALTALSSLSAFAGCGELMVKKINASKIDIYHVPNTNTVVTTDLFDAKLLSSDSDQDTFEYYYTLKISHSNTTTVNKKVKAEVVISNYDFPNCQITLNETRTRID